MTRTHHVPLERRKYMLATEAAQILGITPDRFRKRQTEYMADYAMPNPVPHARPCRFHKGLMQAWLDAFMSGMDPKKLKLHMAETNDALLTAHLPQPANENDRDTLKNAERIAIERAQDPTRLGRKD